MSRLTPGILWLFPDPLDMLTGPGPCITLTQEQSDRLLEFMHDRHAKAAERSETVQETSPLLTVCSECGHVGAIAPEDAATFARVRCECGALVNVPEPAEPREED